MRAPAASACLRQPSDPPWSRSGRLWGSGVALDHADHSMLLLLSPAAGLSANTARTLRATSVTAQVSMPSSMPSISVPKAVMPGSLFSWRQPQESKPLQPVEDRASVRDSIFNNACSADSNSWLVCFLFTVMLVLTLIAKLYGIWMPEADVVDPDVCTTGDGGCE